MADRKSLSKKIRFEIFKRDSFTCQYCGRKSPDVLLEVDHIEPVAAGGTNDILNLITSCFDCNSGKSDRKLSDNTVLNKQRQQLELLQERKEQIEMMFEWQKALLDIEDNVTDRLLAYWREHVPNFDLNENYIKDLKKLKKKFDVSEIMQAIKIAVDTYIEYDVNNKPTKASVEFAWKKVGGICFAKKEEVDNPNLGKLYYIRGILRNRLNYCDDNLAISLLRDAVNVDASIDSLEKYAKSVKSWTQWREGMTNFIESQEQDDNTSDE